MLGGILFTLEKLSQLFCHQHRAVEAVLPSKADSAVVSHGADTNQ